MGDKRYGKLILYKKKSANPEDNLPLTEEAGCTSNSAILDTTEFESEPEDNLPLTYWIKKSNNSFNCRTNSLCIEVEKGE